MKSSSTIMWNVRLWIFFIHFAIPPYTQGICTDGTFGMIGCFYNCNCGTNCDIRTGECSDPCDPGWRQRGNGTCQKKNIAYRKQTSSSPVQGTNASWSHSGAVDGDNDIFGNSSTCYGASGSPSSWTVSFEQSHDIYDINIYIADRNKSNIADAIVSRIISGIHDICATIPGTITDNPIQIKCEGLADGISVKTSRGNDHALVICEVEVYVCSAGTYGDNCEKFCHCKSKYGCNRNTGVCAPGGCRINWHGRSCSISRIDVYEFGCPAGEFGSDCTSDCNCGVSCNSKTGTCFEDCHPGWEKRGRMCQKKNIAYKKRTFALHGTYLDWDSSKAVDGDADMGGGERTCFRANDGPASLTVILGDVYQIYDIRLYLERGFSSSLSNAIVYVNRNQSRICHTFPPSMTSNPVDFLCDSRANSITIYKPNASSSSNRRNHSLNICEIKIYDCSVGTFGMDCTKFCFCKYGNPCDRLTGACPSGGCQGGWQGTSCSLLCHAGTYGSDCTKNCDNRHCAVGKSCDAKHGKCKIGCKIGWNGTDCSSSEENTLNLFGTYLGAIIGLMFGLCCLLYQSCPKKYINLSGACTGSSLGSQVTG